MLPSLNQNYQIDNETILKFVQNTSSEASKVKGAIFKNIVMGDDIDKSVLKQFIGYTNAVLTQFETYGNMIEKKMKDTNGTAGPKSVPYDVIKDYIHSSYDYASALPFTDGLIRLINDKNTTTNEDVEDFFEHTVGKAFKDRATSTAGLVDEVTNDFREARTSIDTAEGKKFNAVKGQKIFNDKDKVELIKTITKVFDFLSDDLNNNRYIRTRDMKLLVSFVNNVIEYITYSITAYITRVFAIQSYAWPFINYKPSDGPVEAYEESVEDHTIHIMHDLDESVARDENKRFEFFKKLDEFANVIGVGISKKINMEDLKDDRQIYIDEDNKIANALIDNPFYEFISQRLYSIFDDYRVENYLMSARDSLNEYLRDNTHALSTSTTPRQALLHTIRGIEPEKDTKESCNELTSDLISFTIIILHQLEMLMNRLSDYRNADGRRDIPNTTNMTAAADIIKLLHELYKEIAVASLMKLRDIEMKINEYNTDEVKELKDMLSVKVPGGNKSDLSSNDNNMSGVPDTERMPTELMSLYAQPTFEYLQMYDEYASSLLPDDEYYIEASEFVNKLKALLEAILKAIQRRWNDVKFNNAVRWVNNHTADLNAMHFTGTMEVFSYKSINVDYIDDVLTKLKNGLTTEVLKDENRFDAFIKTLYPTELYNLFVNDKSDDATKKAKFENYVLFNINPSTSSGTEAPRKKLVDDEIHTEMNNVWIPTINGCSKTKDALISTGKEMSKAVDGIDSKFAQTTGNQTPPPAATEGEENNNQQEQQNVGLTPEVATARLQTAINHLWKNLEPALYKAVNDQYKYIQEAFAIGRK